MKQGVAKVKERYNWPVTIVLYIDHKLLCSVCNNQKQEKE